MRSSMFVVLLASCASGRNEPVVTDASATDSPESPDAAPDAPASSSTCTQAFTGVLATWTFTSETGNQASTAVTTNAPGILAGVVTRSAGLTATSGAGSINSSNWATSAMRDLTKYYTFTIAPPSGCTLSLTAAGIDARASGTGPVSGAISTSADNYAATSTVATATTSTPALTVANANGMIEVRIYGFAASATGGTFRLQTNLTLTGSLQ